MIEFHSLINNFLRQHKLSSNTKKIKATIALSKVKDEDLKVKDFSINDLKNSLFDFKRKLLNEVVYLLFSDLFLMF